MTTPASWMFPVKCLLADGRIMLATFSISVLCVNLCYLLTGWFFLCVSYSLFFNGLPGPEFSSENIELIKLICWIVVLPFNCIKVLHFVKNVWNVQPAGLSTLCLKHCLCRHLWEYSLSKHFPDEFLDSVTNFRMYWLKHEVSFVRYCHYYSQRGGLSILIS